MKSGNARREYTETDEIILGYIHRMHGRTTTKQVCAEQIISPKNKHQTPQNHQAHWASTLNKVHRSDKTKHPRTLQVPQRSNGRNLSARSTNL